MVSLCDNYIICPRGGMVDALASGVSDRKVVLVRIQSWAFIFEFMGKKRYNLYISRGEPGWWNGRHASLRS